MALTNEEKGQLARRIAKGVQVVCSSIAQLHLGSPDPNVLPGEDETGIVNSLRQNGEGKWKFTNIEGALLLTKDAEGVLHFRIYDLNQFKLRFQYELYEDIQYDKLTDQLHTFEMENCMCGFSFSSREVAEKFYGRVQNFKPKKQIVQSSPGYPGSNDAFTKSQKNRRIPDLPPKRSTRQAKTTTVSSFAGSNVPVATPASRRGPAPLATPVSQPVVPQRDTAAAKKGKGDVFLGNGMLDPNNVPKEWKKILKQAGIKKKDLKNPQMFQIIKDVLSSHNIALEPPEELDYSDPRLQQYYTPEQIEEWKQYQIQMKQYKADQERYELELAEYNRQQEKQKKLEKLQQMTKKDTAQTGGMTAKQMLRQSVAQNHGAQFANLRNLVPAGGATPMQMMQAPRMSVARPNVPALPVIPEEERIARIVNSRASKVVLKTNVLAGIKGEINLRRVSALPNLEKTTTGQQNSILETLRQRLAEQRGALENDDEGNDSGSEWEE